MADDENIENAVWHFGAIGVGFGPERLVACLTTSPLVPQGMFLWVWYQNSTAFAPDAYCAHVFLLVLV